jgi:hypothetical protein
MMSFWDLSDNSSAANTGTEYEVPGGNMEPIPDGSSVLAMADEVKWERKTTGEEYISLRWSIVSPDEYKNRKIFHKLWVTDFDPEVLKKGEEKAIPKRDKARKMLAAIDANAGGKLTAKSGKPTDDDLAMALLNKPMIITLMIWSVRDSQSGGTVEGNWVSAVAPKTKGIDVRPAKARPAPSGGGFGGRASRGGAVMDDEIPF